MDLSTRSSRPEFMDDLDDAAYARCLADLARVNRVTRTHAPTLAWLAKAAGRLPPGMPVSVLDVACGHGDLLRAIWDWAARAGVEVRLSGIDLNPRSAIAAVAATPAHMRIAYRTGDVFTDDPQPMPDFIVTSQFTHHLPDDAVVAFLRWLDAHARLGWFIADLHRHALPYYGFRLLAFAMGWHRIVRLDGTTSIARSFRPEEWRHFLERAGLTAEVQRHFPFRLNVAALK